VTCLSRTLTFELRRESDELYRLE